MTGIIKQDVLRFEIAVNDLESVKAFKCAQKFGGIETSSVDIKSLLSLEMVEKLSTVYKGENQI